MQFRSLGSLDGEGTKSAWHVHVTLPYYTLASSCFESLFFSSFLVAAVILRRVAPRLDDLCDKACCPKISCAGLRHHLARLRGDSADWKQGPQRRSCSDKPHFILFFHFFLFDIWTWYEDQFRHPKEGSMQQFGDSASIWRALFWR